MIANSNLRLVLTAAVLVSAARSVDARDWSRVHPRITSQLQTLSRADAATLLAGFCTNGVKTADHIGLSCFIGQLGSTFPDIVDATFHPEAVVYGHFLSPDTEDAAVSGWSAETHPYLWSGTLLLTKRDGRWRPLWYRSAVVTHSCRKVATPSGREILLCEAEDAGMGHVLHYIFSVDLTAPVDVRKSLLAVADSYASSCMVRKQEIERVDWVERSRRLSIEIHTPQWGRTSTEVCAGDPAQAKRPLRSSILEFALYDSGFRPIIDQR